MILDGLCACTQCKLFSGRTHVVAGIGQAPSKIMVCGEAPGREEDIAGKPFVGRAGKCLGAIMAYVGLKREEVFITNVVKCRPPDNRDPLPEEMEACGKWLLEEYLKVNPSILITLGRYAMLWASGVSSISREHGKKRVVVIGNRKVTMFPLFHPAVLLYDPGKKRIYKRDLDVLKSLLVEEGLV